MRSCPLGLGLWGTNAAPANDGCAFTAGSKLMGERTDQALKTLQAGPWHRESLAMWQGRSWLAEVHLHEDAQKPRRLQSWLRVAAEQTKRPVAPRLGRAAGVSQERSGGLEEGTPTGEPTTDAGPRDRVGPLACLPDRSAALCLCVFGPTASAWKLFTKCMNFAT